METIEAILKGEKDGAWLHLAEDIDTAPDYLIEHYEQIEEARIQNLEYDIKFGAEQLYDEKTYKE